MAEPSIYHQDKSQLEAEAVIINKAKSDPRQFEPLYIKYHEQIFRFVYQRSPDRETAADITSIVFMKALTNIQSFTPRGLPFSSWLYRIAVSETSKHYKNSKIERTVAVPETFVKGEIDISDAASKQYQIDQLKEALNQLDDKNLMLIEMRFFEQRSMREIADILNISESNAKVRCFRALKKLKTLYPNLSSHV